MKSSNQNLYYICGGRNFFKANPGRKIFEVVKCWRELGFAVEHICGGDLLTGQPAGDAKTTASGDQRRPGKSTLKKYVPFLFNSISEFRDIQHDKRVLAHLRSLSSGRKPLLIWERSSRLHSAGLRYAREIGVPFVLEWKDLLVLYRRSVFFKRALKLERKKNSQADWVVVESNVLKKNLVETGVRENRIVVAQNAIDPDSFRPYPDMRAQKRTEFGADDDTILVGYLGSYAFYHDTELLVKAAHIVKNPNLKFVLIGDGLELVQCKVLAQKLGVLDRNLIMLPRVAMDAVPAILSAFDIAVLPGSTDIICPIKIQEYMSSEIATVAPKYACNAEVISDEKFGTLFEPKNVESLADSIDILANNARKRQAIASAGRKHILNEFTWAATWGRALEQIVAEV